MTGPTDLQQQADALQWFHTIDLGHGVKTKGVGVQSTGAEIFPDMAGRTVLDIGAWDGKFSFLAEKAGASRIVALDHYAWGVDFGARDVYWRECTARGVLPDQRRDETDFWRPDLPGRRGFDFARKALGSSVEAVVADFATTDLEALGRFDVVLYLGVLYHMKEPLTCLERVRAVTKEVAVIETSAAHLRGLEDQALLEFHAGDSHAHDFTNWYVPTMEALHAMCRAAGFSTVTTVTGPPAFPSSWATFKARTRSKASGSAPPRELTQQTYRAIVHARV